MSERLWSIRVAVLGAAVLVGVGLAGTPARAAEPVQPLQWTRLEDMAFISGGVSMRERRELFDRAGRYDVLVSFAQHDSGQFLADLNVELIRAHEDQAALSMQGVGPYLLAQLPPGRYQLNASAPGWESSSCFFEVRPSHRERVYVTLRKVSEAAP